MIERIIADAIDAWNFTRGNTIDEVANLPAEHFAHRPHPESRSVAELCHHIVDSGLMFVGEIARPDGGFTRRPMPELYAEYASAGALGEDRDAILERLRTSWETSRATLEGLSAEHLTGDMGTLSGAPAMRLRMLGFAEKHEFYHCGQVTVYARTLGVEPALTRKFRAMVGG